MPFIGLLNDETVIPEEVDDGVTVRCPECDGKMVPRGPGEDGRARHFYHTSPTVGNCNGGESDLHKKMKSIAVSSLRQQFPDHARCEAEVSLNTSTTETLPDTRRADALVEFSSENIYYGNGIIIEVQYQNHAKDLFATTHDYLSLGYSVYWATQSDFDNNRLNFDSIESAFSQQKDGAYAVYNYDPNDFSTELAASLDWEDPAPDCDHDWQEVTDGNPQYESCPQCETNRIYDEDRTRYLYDNAEILGPVSEPSSSSHSCSSDGHIWEPYNRSMTGNDVYRCGICSARKVEIEGEWGRETRTIILDMSYMGNDLSELTSDPDACTHVWNSTGDTYECERCGLIDQMPY